MLRFSFIVYVIDPGFVKQNSFNPRTGMASLVVVPVSLHHMEGRSKRGP